MAFITFAFRLEATAISLSILMPPAVEPAQEPAIISSMVMNRDSCPQFSAPSTVNPVDVTAATVCVRG